jgi:hypothetical protein
MAESPRRVLRVLLWMTAGYHVAAGVAATVAQPYAIRLGAFLYGIGITLTPEMELVVRYLGVFGITLGVLAALAALDPVGNRKIIWGLIVYFAIRALDRIVFYGAMQEFHEGPVPAWARIVVILAFAVAFLVLLPRCGGEEA